MPSNHGSQTIIVFSSDDQYAQHTGVSICSLLENARFPQQISIYIIDFDISDSNKSKIKTVVDQYHSQLHFVPVEQQQQNLLKDIQVRNRKHITKAAFGKLMIPELLEDFDKAVFLDSDVIVVDDIEQLYKSDISQHLIGAVLNPFSTRHKELGLCSPQSYFNSGVLLLNLEELRATDKLAEVLDFLVDNKDKIIGAEQDALNAILHKDWKKLDLRWNLQTSVLRKADNAKAYFDEGMVAKAIENPAIIHYSSSSKPWHFINMHPLKGLYYDYMYKTPWRNYVPPDKHFKNIIKMKIKQLLGYKKFETH